MHPRQLEEGDALVLRALEIMAHFDPLMWVIENPATGLLKMTVHGAPSLGGRYLLQVRQAVDQHALEAEPRAVQERQPVEAWEDRLFLIRKNFLKRGAHRAGGNKIRLSPMIRLGPG